MGDRSISGIEFSVYHAAMSDVTRILLAIDGGDEAAADELLPLVYAELRKLAAVKLSGEKLGQTFQPTALVHDAYLRLVDVERPQQWNGRGHFFAAAAEAMRRILVENARRKNRVKHGGGMNRVELSDPPAPSENVKLLALDEALHQLAIEDSQAVKVVELRRFAGLNHEGIAEVLGVSVYQARQKWTFARAWLRDAMKGGE
jgi:RNA polymerase sigma factor (TIGR02999 family)